MFPVSSCSTAICSLGLLCVEEILDKLYFLSSSHGAPVLKSVIYLGGNSNPMPRKINGVIFKKYLGLEEESTDGFHPNMLWEENSEAEIFCCKHM